MNPQIQCQQPTSMGGEPGIVNHSKTSSSTKSWSIYDMSQETWLSTPRKRLLDGNEKLPEQLNHAKPRWEALEFDFSLGHTRHRFSKGSHIQRQIRGSDDHEVHILYPEHGKGHEYLSKSVRALVGGNGRLLRGETTVAEENRMRDVPIHEKDKYGDSVGYYQAMLLNKDDQEIKDGKMISRKAQRSHQAKETSSSLLQCQRHLRIEDSTDVELQKKVQ
ncbi:hypothetical protein Tco_1017688 [Tanacetum coccineum]|uniref:Uncharacterized protein n=1 Tax=Tanacetum coccineum TaxID=301880 RepID=A0ABQ5FS61_9ASTR